MQLILKKFLLWDYHYTEKLRLSQNPKWLWRLATFFAHSGDSWYCLGGLVIIWILKTGYWHRIAASLGSGTFFLAIIVIAIKFTIRRRRPEGEWGEIYRSTDPHSFPSGHATRVFFLASMAWGIAPIWFAILLTIWAPFVAISRVMTGVHYLSDIIAGIIIGWGLGKLALLILPEIIHFFPYIF
jgi:undecaprenyl-diphosphatase